MIAKPNTLGLMAGTQVTDPRQAPHPRWQQDTEGHYGLRVSPDTTLIVYKQHIGQRWGWIFRGHGTASAVGRTNGVAVCRGRAMQQAQAQYEAIGLEAKAP